MFQQTIRLSDVGFGVLQMRMGSGVRDEEYEGNNFLPSAR